MHLQASVQYKGRFWSVYATCGWVALCMSLVLGTSKVLISGLLTTLFIPLGLRVGWEESRQTSVWLQSSFLEGRNEKTKFCVVSEGLDFQNRRAKGWFTLEMLEISLRNLIPGQLVGRSLRFPKEGSPWAGC